MREVYLVSAVRTPIGRFGGALKDHSPVDLAAHAMKAAIDRGGVDGGSLDLYMFGNVLRAGHGQLIPRQAALKAGIPDHVDGVAIDMVCSSGMMSVMSASAMIRAGDAEIILAGGVESMSGTGFYSSSRARWGYKFLMGAPEEVKDLLLYDGLTDPMSGEPMGDQTERLAAELGVAREDLDAVATESHRRASAARQDGRFDTETASIEYRKKRETVVLDFDEGVRGDTSVESLSKLRPAFSKDGVLTAGNSSQISDGAAAILLASKEAIEQFGLKPIARLMGGAWSAGESWRFPEAPIPAVKKVVERLGMTVKDFGLFENNEAFALNSLLFNRMLGVPLDRLNVHGGAIRHGASYWMLRRENHRDPGARPRVAQRRKWRGRYMPWTGGGTAVAIERV